MRKIIISIVLLISFSAFSNIAKDSISVFTFQRLEMVEDCDVCGCSASGGSMGFNSMLSPNFIGVRYFKQSYTSRDGIFANSPWIDENFNTLQVWSRIPIGHKVQITALIPYHSHERELTSGTENIAGLGDITVMGSYTLFSTQKEDPIFTHKLSVGGGIKIPTGKFTEKNNLGRVNQSFQLGTGSWDYSLISEYIVNRKNLGLNTTLNYIFKTQNSKDYQYGNQFNYNSTLFYSFEVKTIQLVPQAGIAGEIYKGNSQYQLDLPNTAGAILFSKFGIEAGKNDLSVGLNLMTPVHQNLAEGNMKANYRWSINLNYSL